MCPHTRLTGAPTANLGCADCHCQKSAQIREKKQTFKVSKMHLVRPNVRLLFSFLFSWVTGLLTSVTSVSGLKVTLPASLQDLATFSGNIFLEVLNIHGTGHNCDVSDSPSSVVIRSENVPTVTLVWASPHHYTRHGAFSNDCYWCGTSGFGKSWTGLWSGLLLVYTFIQSFPSNSATK